ncbi:MAG: MaoC/PaaZ C-terminal domain-containing protein [Kofleriaceae bacterium]
MALNRACLGRLYTGAPIEVTDDELRGFIEALRESPTSWRDRNGAALAHPAFPFKLVRTVMPQLLDDPELGVNRQRMVHGEQGFTYHQPIRAGELITVKAEIVGIEDKPTGQVLRTEQRMYSGDALAVTGVAVAFIRGDQAKPATATTREPRPPAPERLQLRRATRDVDAALARRYAEASGDHNPIHLDEAAARNAGLGGIILHGACTLALAMSELARGAGASHQLQQVFARFVRPVRLPNQLEIAIWDEASGVGFEVRTGDGELVLGAGNALLG